MLNNHRIGALLLMGGSGSRFGGKTPKQFLPLASKQVYLHTLETFQKSALFDEIILVCHPDWIAKVSEEAPEIKVIEGGQTRQESSFLGLQAFDPPPEIVLIHDAVRPFVSIEILERNIEKALLYGAVDTCIPSADTLVHSLDGKIIDSIPKRQEYLRGQTPQTFRYPLILQAHRLAKTKNATDDCQLVLLQGHPIHIVLGEEKNIKITTNFDLTIAHTLYQMQSMR